MITEKEIEQAAKKYHLDYEFDSWIRQDITNSFEAGANFVLKDMDSEMCLFAEWRDEQITGSWIEEDNVKKYRIRSERGVITYLSISELLQIYKNRAK